MHGINLNKLCFQSYDYTASMIGQFNGVPKKILDKLGRRIRYMPCLAHSSNTVIEHSCQASAVVKEPFTVLDNSRKAQVPFNSLSVVRNYLSGPYWKSLCELGPLSKYYDKKTQKKTRYSYETFQKHDGQLEPRLLRRCGLVTKRFWNLWPIYTSTPTMSRQKQPLLVCWRKSPDLNSACA